MQYDFKRDELCFSLIWILRHDEYSGASLRFFDKNDCRTVVGNTVDPVNRLYSRMPTTTASLITYFT